MEQDELLRKEKKRHREEKMHHKEGFRDKPNLLGMFCCLAEVGVTLGFGMCRMGFMLLVSMQ